MYNDFAKKSLCNKAEDYAKLSNMTLMTSPGSH